MGFVPPRKIYKLQFADGDFQGAEVRMRGISTGQFMDIGEDREKAEEEYEARVRLFSLTAEQLVSWNLEREDGTPVPANLDGIREQDLRFTFALIDAYQQAIAGVPDPLQQGSPSGEPSPEASIPMETLSPSPENSAVPA